MKNLFNVMMFATLLSGCAKTLDGTDANTKSAGVDGESTYHSVYGNIQHTYVTLRNFRIRTTSGQVVSVATSSIKVDLQDLQAAGKGLPLNLTGVSFPGGVKTIDVAEIESDVVGTDARTVSSDNSSCNLATPSKMNFYAAAPIAVIAGEQYLVKVQFSPLNSIQIDFNELLQHRKLMETAKQSDCFQRCELVNRRQLTNDILRPIDEF